MKTLPPSKLHQAWKLVKQLKGILKSPVSTDDISPRRKRGRPRKVDKTENTGISEPTENNLQDAKGSNVNAASSDITTDERIRQPRPEEQRLFKRPQRKASIRFQKFLTTLRKETKATSDDDDDEGSNLGPGDDSKETTPPNTKDSTQDDNTVGETVVQTNMEGDEVDNSNGLMNDVVEDTEARTEKIPVRGPTKLSQAELAFFEGCRMMDGLGWKCSTCGKILNNRANLKGIAFQNI